MNTTEKKLSQGNDSCLPTNISSVPKNNLTLDLDQVRAYINLLGGGHQVYRAFHDKKESSKIFYPEGELEKVKEELVSLIKGGFGIFAVVNGKNYKKVSKGPTIADEDITKTQFAILDLDEAPLQPVLDTGFKPHLIVLSSNTIEKGERFQVYWKVSDCQVDEYEQLQKSLIRKFNGDVSIKNPSRVMRVPGTWHQKYEPFMTQILKIDADLPAYTVKEMVEGMDLQLETKTKTKIARQPSRSRRSDPADDGERNKKLVEYAGELENKNYSYDEILERLRQANARYNPPETDEWVVARANSTLKWRAERVAKLDELYEQLKLAKQADRINMIQDHDAKDALRLCEATDPARWYTIRTELFKGCVTELRKAVETRPIPVLAPPSGVNILKEIPGAPKEYPGSLGGFPVVDRYYFQQTDKGTGLFYHLNDERQDEVCHTMVFITKRLIRDHQETYLEAAWLEKGRWRYLEAPRSSFLNANRILDLGDHGFPVGTANNRILAQYLQAFEATYFNLIPEQKTSSQMGWKAKSFLLGRDVFAATEDQTPIKFHGSDGGEESLVGGLRTRGDYNKWAEAVKTVSQYPFSMTALYASVAAPLLKILETPSILVDFSALSSTGKTINLHVAASFWGQPDETMSPSVTHTWDMTDVAIERLCSVMCDLPVILDETKRQKRERISKNIYTIIHGQGRARGSKKGMQVTKSWRVVGLSTGEAPIVSYTTDTGVRARTLSLRGQPFGANNHETKRLVDNLDDVIKHNYGHAGPMFVKWLVDNQDRWPEFRDKLRDNIAALKAKAGVSFRLANSAAVITTAGQLVHEALDLPWEFNNPIAKVWPQLLKDSEDADICDRAVVVFGDYVASHPDRFFNKHKEKDSKTFVPHAGWYGRCDDSITAPCTHIDFIPLRLKEICKTEELDYGAVIDGLKEKGLATLKSSRINGCVLKVFRISRKVIEDDQSGGCGICAKNNGCEKEPCEWDSWADRCPEFVEDTARDV